MFADDTNLHFEHKDVKILLSLIYQELQKIKEWLEANKLCLNGGKTKNSLLHKRSTNNNLLILLPALLNSKKGRIDIKFLGVLHDEHLS